MNISIIVFIILVVACFYLKPNGYKVIWAHPCTGKTWIYTHYPNLIVDFDSTFKKELDKELGTNGYLEREGYKQRNKKDYEAKLLKYYIKAKEYCKKEGKILCVSDCFLLRDHHKDFNHILTLSTGEFLRRCKQRNDYSIKSHLWKFNINELLQKVDKSKVEKIDCYLIDWLKN